MHYLHFFIEGGANPLQSFLGMEGEIPSEGSVPGGGVAATNMLLGNSTVLENSTVPRMSVEEYFTPPQNPKEYDGTCTCILYLTV